MNAMCAPQDKGELALRITEALESVYPDASCALEAGSDPWKLLIMGILSAQCTDRRVNEVSRELFRYYPNCSSLSRADTATVETLIRPCGLFRTKARNIIAASAMLMERYQGSVPEDMEELVALPGVGRKIANLVRGDVFGLPAIVADTHCIRIANRLGLCSTSDPEKVERALIPLIPPNRSAAFCHRLVRFGRDCCAARSPRCGECPLRSQGLCRWSDVRFENNPR